MTKSQYGVWEITLPPEASGQPAIPHDSKLKASSTLSSVLDNDKRVVELDIHDPPHWCSNRKIACLDTSGHSRLDVLPGVRVSILESACSGVLPI